METKEFENQLKSQRKTLYIVTVSLSVITLALLVLYVLNIKKSEQKIYVISDSGRFQAIKTEDAVVYDFDLKNHVKLFINNMYGYDQYNYDNHIDLALGLIDDYYGKFVYNNLKDNEVFENMKRYNMMFKVSIDSVKIDMKKRPYECIAYFKSKMYYSDQMKSNAVAFHCLLSEVQRSENNPFGFMMTNFSYIDYKLPKEQNSIMYDAAENNEQADSLLKSE